MPPETSKGATQAVHSVSPVPSFTRQVSQFSTTSPQAAHPKFPSGKFPALVSQQNGP
jgi:hypothetical protein